MQRICTTLAGAGYSVTLVGHQLSQSKPLAVRSYQQKRLPCIFTGSFLFYLEYNIRLFAYLLTRKMDAVCAIDLDTALPCLAVSGIKKIPRIYDAHEYFTELKEVRTRPVIKKVWTAVERFTVPRFKLGYTVSEGLAAEFYTQYKQQYAVIRNLPLLQDSLPSWPRENFIVYQGAVNEARGFETLIPAMRNVPYKLLICGDGNFMAALKTLIWDNDVADKVELTGMLLPEDLRPIAAKAVLGIGLAEKAGTNQYWALPNKFLEYMHAGLPQIAMNFPEYQKINDQFHIAVLLDDLEKDDVAAVINRTMADQSLLEQMHRKSLEARNVYCWQQEEKRLLEFYQRIIS